MTLSGSSRSFVPEAIEGNWNSSYLSLQQYIRYKFEIPSFKVILSDKFTRKLMTFLLSPNQRETYSIFKKALLQRLICTKRRPYKVRLRAGGKMYLFFSHGSLSCTRPSVRCGISILSHRKRNRTEQSPFALPSSIRFAKHRYTSLLLTDMFRIEIQRVSGGLAFIARDTVDIAWSLVLCLKCSGSCVLCWK
jgi:hypothetical protein